MRQRLGPKKVAKYAKMTGLPLVGGLVRGGTGYRVDLMLEDGSIRCLWPDGEVTDQGSRRKAEGKTEA